MMVQKYVKHLEATEKNAQWVTKQYLMDKCSYTKNLNRTRVVGHVITSINIVQCLPASSTWMSYHNRSYMVLQSS